MTESFPAFKMQRQKLSFDSGQSRPLRQLAILLILLLATGLQFYGLASDSLWGDEIFTAIFAAQSPAETIAFTASDIHPPLYYLLAGSLSHTPLWPDGPPTQGTDWLWRWPSAMLAVLAVALTYRLGAQLAGWRVGLLAALLLAAAPVAIKYGQEARMHALFMTLSVGATWLLVRAWRGGRWQHWIGYGLLTVLNLYTMYFAFIVLAVHGAWVLARAFAGGRQVRRWPSGPVWRWGGTVAIAVVAYLPWWPVLLEILVFRARVGAVEGGVGSPWQFLPAVIRSLGPAGPGAWLFFGGYLLGLGLAWRRDRSLAVLGGLWLLLPAFLPIVLGDSRARQLRYAFVLPVYLTVIALAVVWLAAQLPKRARRWGGAALAGGLVALSLVGVGEIYGQRKPDWRGAAAFVSEHAGPHDLVLAGPLWDDSRFFAYYYPQPTRVLRPPVLAARLPGAAADMAAAGAKLWLVTRHPPDEMKRFTPHHFYGVTVMAQTEPNYDPVGIVNIGAALCREAADGADEWARTMEAEGVLNPDPRSSRAAAYFCEGETYAAAGDPERALKPYRRMVEAFPGWAGGHVILAKTYLVVDNLPAACAAFADAISFNPAWQGPAAAEAARLADEKKWAEAVAVYQTIIEE